MSRNMDEWLKSLKSGKEKRPIPLVSSPGVQLIGTDMEMLVNDSDIQSQCVVTVAEKINAAAAVLPMDLSVEAECFGAKVKFSKNEVPSVIGAVVETMEDAQNLKVPSAKSGRAGLFIKTIEKTVELIADRPVLAGSIGPFSFVGRLVDVTLAMIYCFDEPEMLHVMLDKCTTFLIDYINEYKKAGANGVILAEPLSGLLSPSMEAEFSAPYVKRIVDAVDDKSFIVVYHNCGNAIAGMTESFSSNGCRAFHFGNAVDMKEMLEKMPKDKIVMGNLDPVGIMLDSTPEAVSEATWNLLERCEQYPNFAISTGCDVPSAAKWENIEAFMRTVKEYNK